MHFQKSSIDSLSEDIIPQQDPMILNTLKNNCLSKTDE